MDTEQHGLPPISDHNHPQSEHIFQLIIITTLVVGTLSSIITYIIVK